MICDWLLQLEILLFCPPNVNVINQSPLYDSLLADVNANVNETIELDDETAVSVGQCEQLLCRPCMLSLHAHFHRSMNRAGLAVFAGSCEQTLTPNY